MEIEYEATFCNINKNDVKGSVKKAGAKLVKSEFMQKRVVFNLPSGHEINGGWLRVCDEGDKITLSLKVIDGDEIYNQKEICLKVDDFSNAVILLESIGCKRKAYQESMRELWILDDTEICIDEWPYLEPYVEVEGKLRKALKKFQRNLDLIINSHFFVPLMNYIKENTM